MTKTENKAKMSNQSSLTYYLSQISLLSFSIPLLYTIWKQGYKYFNLHPTLMILSYYSMTQAILSLKVSPGKQGRLQHQKYQSLAVISFISSFAIIYLNNQLHFQSPHAIMGTVLTVFSLVVAPFGSILFFNALNFPQDKLKEASKSHGFAGYILYSFITLNLLGGIELAYNLSKTNLAFVVYPSLVLSTLIVLFSKKQDKIKSK